MIPRLLIMLGVFCAALNFTNNTIAQQPAGLEPAQTIQYDQQRYLRMRWHGPMNNQEPMDVTFAVDQDGRFIRGWAWSEKHNRMVYYPGNRKVREYVEHGMNAPDLRLQDNQLTGQVNISLGNKPTPYLMNLKINDKQISGQWSYTFGKQQPGTPIPEAPFNGFISPNLTSLRLTLDLGRPQSAAKNLGKYAKEVNIALKKDRDGAWRGFRFRVLDMKIEENQFTAHIAFLDNLTRQDGVIFWNEYKLKGELGETEERGIRIQGISSGVYNKEHTLTGKVTGALLTEAEFRSMNPLDPKQDYPAYRGPYSDYRAHDQPYELVDDLRNAHLLWKSDPTPPGRAQDKRYFSNNHNRGIGGGGCSPILYDGKVYLFYVRPAGPDYDEAFVQRIKNAGLPLVLDQWRIAADEYILCLDASTGRTLWRTRLPLRGLNYPIGAKSGGNMTPTAGEGKIFAIGSTLRIYALDANTGEMLWENNLGSKHRYLENQKQQAIKRKEVWSWNRDNNGSPIYVNGVVVVTNFDETRYRSNAYPALLGFDARTGEKRWEIKGAGGPQFTPATWEHEGQTYVIATGKRSDGDPKEFESIYCIVPETGELKWKIPAGSNDRGFTIHGDYMLTNSNPRKDKRTPRIMGCYSLKEGKLLWTFEGEANHTSFSHQISYDNEVVLQLDNHLIWVDLATGKETHRIKGRPANSYPVRMGNKAFIEYDGTHSLNQYVTVDLDKKQIMHNLWSPPHKQQSGYAHNQSKPMAEGRMYFRGGNSIVAYDLRKIMQIEHAGWTDGLIKAKAIATWLKDPDLKYNWTFSDGTSKTGPQVDHRFALPQGTKIKRAWVRLEITASNGMRRVAEQPIYLTGAFIEPVKPGKRVPGVLMHYHQFTPKRQPRLSEQLDKRKAEETWLYPTPDARMVLKNKPGVLKVTGYIRVPEDGLYYFTPARDSYSGSLEGGGVQLYLHGDLVTGASSVNTMRALPLKAGLHPFTLVKPNGKALTTQNIQLLLSPVSVSSWLKPVPDDALFRPANVKHAKRWTGKREVTKEDIRNDILDELESDFDDSIIDP